MKLGKINLERKMSEFIQKHPEVETAAELQNEMLARIEAQNQVNKSHQNVYFFLTS